MFGSLVSDNEISHDYVCKQQDALKEVYLFVWERALANIMQTFPACMSKLFLKCVLCVTHEVSAELLYQLMRCFWHVLVLCSILHV